MSGLNLVNKLGGLAFSWDEIKPAPRNHHILRQTKYAISNGIAMMMIIKKPAVDVAFAQGSLYGGKVHGQLPILASCGPTMTRAVLPKGLGVGMTASDRPPEPSGHC